MEQTERGYSDPQVVKRFRIFTFCVAALSVLAATLVLVGWEWNIAWLKAMIPGQAEMKANTAAGIFLMGLALVACQFHSRWARLLSPGLSLAVGVLGALTLVQYAWQIDFGIDQLLFADPGQHGDGGAPGRMSQVSALSFILLAGVGVASCSRQRGSTAQWLALAVIAIALYALSTLGYQGVHVPGRMTLKPIAVQTALLLLLLALGWLAARPESGVMRVLSAQSFGGTVVRRALLPSLLVPSLVSYLAQQLQTRGLLTPDATITLLAVASGGLVAWIIWSVGVLLDRVEREQRVTSHLREDAITDALTQLPNRRGFNLAIQGLLQRRRDEDALFSLLILDLDKFKVFNDTHGHVAGDRALRQVGDLLKAALRPGDMAARYGGEEFAVLLPGTDGERALLVAERIRRDFHVAHWETQPITASIGVTQARADDHEEQLVARADRALYAAKAGGRDRVVLDTALPPENDAAPLQPSLL